MKDKFLAIILLFLLAIVYWQWFIPELRVASDFPSVSNETLKTSMDFPRAWSAKGSEGLGEYAVFTLWSYPLAFISGVLANLGISFILLERIFLLMPFLIIGSIGIWKFCQYLNLSNYSKLIASFFYLSNTYILLLIDGGQLQIALAYAWLPICFLLIENSIQKSLKQQIVTGLAITILGYFDIRFIYILFLLVFFRFLYEFLYLEKTQWIKWISRFLINGFIWIIIIIALNVYWWFPLLEAPLAEDVYSNLTRSSFLSPISLGHSLLMLAPNWFLNVFGKITSLRWEFVFIPMIVFLAPILKPRNRVVGFWLWIALVSIFLVKGSSEPISSLYPWLFANLPFFSLFRDSSKFFFLVALSYSVLIGISTNELLKKIEDHKKIQLTFLFLSISYLLFLIRPVWMGKMTGTFSSPQFQDEYSQFNKVLLDDKQFSRIFWIPALQPLTNLDLQHPAVEATRLIQKRPFAIGTVGTYETFNFLREASYMGQIFDVAGIGYIAYPYPDTRRDNDKDNIKYYYTFLKQLSERPWLTKINDSPIALLKVKEHQDRFFVTPNIWWVIGSDSIYTEATKSAQLKLARNALIFPEERAGLGQSLEGLPEAKIVLNDKTDLDFAASLINVSQLIFPARELGLQPNKSGWWKRGAADLIAWRSFLKSKYGIDNQDFDLGGEWAIGEGDLELQINTKNQKAGKVLLARVMESSRSGNLSFYQGNQLIGKVSTKTDKNANVKWFEIGKINSEEEIKVFSSGNINVINALAVVNEDEWTEKKMKVSKLVKEGRVVSFKEDYVKDFDVAISYQQINPTKYIVSVKGLKDPALLIFSQNYNKLWTIEKSGPLPVYSLLNGFMIDGDGDYIIEFQAQKYVYQGLLITGLMVIIIVILLLGNKNLFIKHPFKYNEKDA